MVAEDSVFVTEGGDRISVRVLPAALPATAVLEPLYASDLEVLDGATGELRVSGGMTLRGTVQREGRIFALYPEPPVRQAPPPPAHDRPSEISDRVRDEFTEPARSTAPSQAEAIEAAETVAGFVGGDPGIELKQAKQAHALLSRFIANWDLKRPE